MKNILFISWDGPTTNYLEGLFFPIFQDIQKLTDYQFHVLQFTWADEDKIQLIGNAAKKAGIHYSYTSISRKPIVSIGSFLTVFKGIKVIQDYISNHNIQILMPRSTFPAMMVNRLKVKELKIIFDADGLPIEERIDLGKLKRSSLLYKYLINNETKIISKADVVLVRSEKAIEYHLRKNSKLKSSNFFVVYNGRNPDVFRFNKIHRDAIRKKLNLNDEILFVYCGSLDGNKYLFAEMIKIFTNYNKINKNSKFLILTGNIDIKSSLTSDLQNSVIIKTVPFKEVPKYLSAADLSLGIIKQLPSMEAVSAIKLGEYLLMGLPTIFSSNIGDSTKILENAPNCFLYNENDIDNDKKILEYINTIENVDHKEIRNAGLNYFSLEKSVESYIRALESIS